MMITFILTFLLGGMVVLAGLAVLITLLRRIKIGPVVLLWSTGEQQVARLRTPAAGEVFLIKDSDDRTLYVDSGSNAMVTMRRTIKQALTDADYFKWLRDEVVGGRKIRVRIVATQKNETERRTLVKSYVTQLRPILNTANQIKVVNEFIDVEANNDTSNAGTDYTGDGKATGMESKNTGTFDTFRL